MPLSDQIPFEGVLNCWNDEHDLPDLLLAISRAGKTGRLHFSNPEGDKTLFIKQGRIIFAESSSVDDGLGPFLLRTGQVSLMDYSRVAKLVEPGKRLGALLVEHGVLQPKDLVPAVLGQVRAVILGLFRRTETWYRFKEEELSRKEAITLDMPVAQLIVDGVQYVDSWRRISKGVGGLDSVHRLSEAGRKESVTVQIEGSVREILEMLEEAVSLTEVCERTTLPDFEACRYLWAFRSLEWIELAGIEAAASIPNPTQVEPSQVVTVQAVARPPLEPPAVASTTPDPASSSAPEMKPPEPELPKPAAAQPELAQTQVAMDVPATPPPVRSEEPPSIPQNLVQTQRSVQARKPLDPPPPPRPVSENLVQTQVSVAPAASKKPAAPDAPPTAAPTLKAPASPSIPENLSSTQLYLGHPAVEPPESSASPPPPAERSTRDMMEAILKGEDDGVPSPSAPRPAPEPERQAVAEPPSPNSTRLFGGKSALLPLNVEDSYADFVPSGFEALASGNDLDESPSSDPATSPPMSPPTGMQSPPLEAPDDEMTSFGDLAYGDESFENVKAEEVIDPAPPPEPFVPRPPEPTVEPRMVEDVEIVEAESLPTVEAVSLPAEPEPIDDGAPSGMEVFAVPDATEAPQFATDDPMNASASLDPPMPPPPKRRHTEDMDVDMDGLGHVLGGER